MSNQETPDAQDAQETKDEDQALDTFDRATVEGLRSEAASWRTKLRAAEKQVEDLTGKVTKYEDANKSELERLTNEKTRLEATVEEGKRLLEESAVSTAVKLAAARADVIDPDAALALIDRSEINFSDGSTVGVEKALKKLLKDKPYLVKGEEKPVPPTPGAGGPPIEGKVNTLDKALLGLFQSAQRKE